MWLGGHMFLDEPWLREDAEPVQISRLGGFQDVSGCCDGRLTCLGELTCAPAASSSSFIGQIIRSVSPVKALVECTDEPPQSNQGNLQTLQHLDTCGTPRTERGACLSSQPREVRSVGQAQPSPLSRSRYPRALESERNKSLRYLNEVDQL